MDEDPLVARLRRAGCVFAEDEAAELRAAPGGAGLEALVRRREAGEPLEHVLGRARFAGVEVPVSTGVFVPRRRSELVVEEAERRLSGRPAGAGDPVLVELCCGAAAITRVLLGRVPRLRAWAGDVDPVAVRCAASALAGVPGVLGVAVSDLDAAVPADLAGRVDALAAHVPYVPTAMLDTLPREAREHEPRRALDGGADGLALLRAVAALAPRWLAPEGVLLIEVAPAQVPEAEACCRRAGLEPALVEDPDRDRGGLVLVARRAGEGAAR